MLAITTHKFLFFSRKEFWFYDGEKINEGSYNVFSVAKKITDTNVQLLQKYSTCIIDLSKKEEGLFLDIQPRYRSYIRSAEKEKFICTHSIKVRGDELKHLCNSFNKFAELKKIKPIRYSWLKSLNHTQNICLTKMKLDQTDIITHIYIFDNDTIILSQTFHNIDFKDERIRSNANKLLHWKDILLFKTMGFKYYDFGGINPEKLPGISKFKINFGGEVKEYYRYIKTPSFFFFLSNIYKSLLS